METEGEIQTLDIVGQGKLRHEIHFTQEQRRFEAAKAAMQGLIAGYIPRANTDEYGIMIHSSIFKVAVQAADALLAELERTKK